MNYEAQLGPSHQHMIEEIFRAEFTEAKMFDTVDAARLEPGLMAIFEPRIEQFSFASAKETGGVFCAVTIRYQIFIYAPNGELVDTLTLTGYGSGPAPKIGNGEEELGIAAYAAMRDAAAKFLTQFQGLELAKPLLASQALTAEIKTRAGFARSRRGDRRHDHRSRSDQRPAGGGDDSDRLRRLAAAFFFLVSVPGDVTLTITRS